MEYLLMALAIAGFVAVVVILDFIRSKKEEKKFIQKLYQDYRGLANKKYTTERFEKINSYYLRHKKDKQIDDITWNDLGMDEIFKKMNACLSATGEEYLYYTLRTIDKNTEELQHLESVIQYFAQHPDQRVQYQLCMKKLGNTGKYSLYDYIENLDYLGEQSNRKHIIVLVLMAISIAMMWVQFSFGIIGFAALMIYNIVTYFKDKSVIGPYITSFAYIIRLLDVCDRLEKLKLEGCTDEIEKIKTHKKALNPMRRNSFWVMFDTKTALSSGDILSGLLDYIKMSFHIDLMKFNNMLKYLKNHVADVDSLIGTVGYLETAICVWIYRENLENGWCCPEFSEEGIHMEDGYHPLLEHPVKNSIKAEKGVLITGSNASGKSTFLKTVAVNGLLSQSVNTCTAKKFVLQPCMVYSSMSLRDDIDGGDSYYMVEIKAIKRILDAAKGKDKILCFVDEVLRGTNTVERIAASTEILKSFIQEGVLCFAATHDIELTGLLNDYYENYHFREEVIESDIKFDYILREGKATTRNAIRLLELMGYEREIVENATKQAEHFVKTGSWKEELRLTE